MESCKGLGIPIYLDSSVNLVGWLDCLGNRYTQKCLCIFFFKFKAKPSKNEKLLPHLKNLGELINKFSCFDFTCQ